MIATPHLGASTHEAQISVAVDAVESVIRALEGKPVKNAVNAPAMRAEGVDGLGGYLKLAERLGHFFTSAFGGNFDRLEVVFRGDVDNREFISFWLRDGVVLAGMNVNIWDAGDEIERLLASGAPVDPDRLADPSTPLSESIAR